MKSVRILGIETSCDETAVAVVLGEQRGSRLTLVAETNLVSTQIPTHRKHGGVVPEVAAREHATRLPLLLKRLAGTPAKRRALEESIDAIAVTTGPGLVTCLATGTEVARTIASAWRKPLVPIHHLEGHIYANLLSRHTNAPAFLFPVLVLVVSGAHTELVLMKRHLNYQLLGSTRDDAVGEAFDKSAKLLGLPYPGGPELSKLALSGKRDAVAFPRAMLKHDNFDFSFAGLKTAVALEVERHRTSPADVAASFEQAAVDTLIEKTVRAVARYAPKTVALAGGVAANLPLRQALRETIPDRFPNVSVLEPDLQFTTDNAAMIAAAGAVRVLTKKVRSRIVVTPRPELR